jgi:hypothetical protein
MIKISKLCKAKSCQVVFFKATCAEIIIQQLFEGCSMAELPKRKQGIHEKLIPRSGKI